MIFTICWPWRVNDRCLCCHFQEEFRWIHCNLHGGNCAGISYPYPFSPEGKGRQHVALNIEWMYSEWWVPSVWVNTSRFVRSLFNWNLCKLNTLFSKAFGSFAAQKSYWWRRGKKDREGNQKRNQRTKMVFWLMGQIHSCSKRRYKIKKSVIKITNRRPKSWDTIKSS